MTVSEMHQMFRVLVDRIEANYYKNILPEEIDIFLNSAQERFIKDRIGTNNPKKTGFEETQKRIEDLRTIVIPDVSLSVSATQTGAKPGGIFYDFPADYFIAVQEEADIKYTDCAGNKKTKRLGFIKTTLDDYNVVKDDPFSIPDPSNEDTSFGLRLMFDRLEALTFSKFTILTYYLTYVKVPATIRYGTQYISPTTDVNCELPAQTHREIVNIAVNIALETIESNRFGQNRAILQEQE